MSAVFSANAVAAPRQGVAKAAVSRGSSAFLNTGMRTAFKGNAAPLMSSLRTGNASRMVTVMAGSALQFIRGVDESCVPDVKLTRAKDGSSGTATFVFDEPDVFDSSGEMGEITGLYMVDDEGSLQTVDVNAKFVNGQPAGIEARYVMKSSFEWDRFMRFMERYAEDNELGFSKSG
mmetsp:Transcript_24458/g.77298  ORF Transcript_24458/g.77298 Transcript_24458/m.77298 type:complete len:176 (+) Transcript_24458:249-776(+)|eukprot:CAMPEP_0182871300 /NCGR_PEP_ID=MMETSP0034_2-20130328/11040_1 /TAXON_ID=156128 /ORGANISM="Nephroselmis pyriformis, Strain CCMP717" /LENGTH=175 /DNA_ID=CAMNT_0025003845 /DNA_START=233 /DNA_END=760 /DNA_ORIENTATION=-